ncbi:MAG: AMP-binding protein [Pseudomonadales bacterium]|jgi:crotonobetaine/carnitine-CoA ligase|nr:AMP-binding protein [Pseudomonadales bacterium]MDP6472222.1 AMP-binding protein [Pseudomonadales bacterium]MDP6826526.1 AMP-binding protein [Pseudomonadales bacterium]MDP6970334.1 AMP-binding protein [Pseudomonadales bacterium]
MARERSEMILADIVATRAERNPEFEVLTFECAEREDETRTYAQLYQRGNALAADLIGRGLERGDKFGLFMRNHPEFVEAMIAASITGTVFVPIDARTRGAKLAYTLRNSGSKAVVCADYALAQFEEVRGELPDIGSVLVLETGESGAPELDAFRDVEALGPILSSSAAAVDVRIESPQDPLQIIYTSGTTGDPKGVVMENGRYGGMAGLGAGVFRFQDDERLYTGLSLTHGNAQAVTLASALCLELPAVISRKFTKSRLWDICRKHGCTTFSLLGGMATAIYSEPERPGDGDNPVRMVTSAGMPYAIWESFEKRFNLKVLEWYGAVEGGLAFKPIGEGPIGSFGKPGPGLDMRLLDDNDEVCAPGVQGEICSRPLSGDAPSVEYHANPEASEKKTRGGWLRSGDIGHTDEDGWLYFDYRKGGGIRRSGDFINPGFVEKVVAEHPAISDVFVYGVEARSGAPGEKDVVAAVVAVPGATVDALAVRDHCRNGLEANFVPTYLQVVDEIPKTASEKPQERFLRERFDEVPAEVNDLDSL